MPNFRNVERAKVIILDGKELFLKECRIMKIWFSVLFGLFGYLWSGTTGVYSRPLRKMRAVSSGCLA